MAKTLYAKVTAVSVPATGNTVLMTVDVAELERVMIEVDVTVQALDAFIIQAKGHDSATLGTFASATGDFTTPAGIVVKASGDLTGQGVGHGWVLLNVRGLRTLVVSVSAAVDSALVTAYASGS